MNLPRFARALLRSLLLVVPAVGVATALARGQRAGTYAAMVSAALVVVLGIVVLVRAHLRASKALPRLLEDGRSLVKRLGWQDARPLAGEAGGGLVGKSGGEKTR